MTSLQATGNTTKPITPTLRYRPIERKDKAIIQKLHEDFFPVRYSSQFYDDIVQGIGIFNGKLYSIIVEKEEEGEVVGFVLAQLLEYPAQCEDHDLFNPTDKVSQVLYILTIGCVPEYRQRGIASRLIGMCVEYARSVESCGAVYLHVIDYNHSAVKLYEKNHFQYLKTNQSFYHINEEYYSALVYILYLRDYRIPFYHNIYQSISRATESGWSAVSSALSHWFSGNSLWGYLRFLTPLTAPTTFLFQSSSNRITEMGDHSRGGEGKSREVEMDSLGNNSQC